MVIVGDAAHRVHPLAGQGVNLGFGDVKSLVQCLEDNVLDGAKFGSFKYLMDYEKERLRHNMRMMFGIDFLQQVHGSENKIICHCKRHRDQDTQF